MKKVIHIIEDDIDLLTVLKIFFQKKGYDVIADLNGNSLDVHRQPCPDLYLVDINLAGKKGTSICKMIKEECQQVPVVLMSANENLEAEAKDCMADNFVAKPFDINNMFSVVHKLAAYAAVAVTWWLL